MKKKPLKMLIVDDSNVIRRKIERSHDNSKFNVVDTAGSGVEAIEKFIALRPQVVTMDLTMPHMDGIECISRLIGLDENIRILVISALSDKATGIEALECGAQGFLCKPFDDERLTMALSELIEDL